MAVTKLPIEVIVSDLAIRSGEPIVDGTRIAVSDLAAYHTNEDQMSPEQLAKNFNLSMG